MADTRQFLLLYGSQTGQAQAIAEEIAVRARQRGFQPDVHCLSRSEKEFHLEKERVVVVVVSTTGDGDPPDTVVKFWRRLRRKTVPTDHLSGCQYALLGLGDSNYTNFCNMGKKLNRRLLELGANQFHEPGFADDGIGMEIVVEPWIDGLWNPLEKVLASDHEQLATSRSAIDAERLTPGGEQSRVEERRDTKENVGEISDNITGSGLLVPFEVVAVDTLLPKIDTDGGVEYSLIPEATRGSAVKGSPREERDAVDGNATSLEDGSTPSRVLHRIGNVSDNENTCSAVEVASKSLMAATLVSTAGEKNADTEIDRLEIGFDNHCVAKATDANCLKADRLEVADEAESLETNRPAAGTDSKWLAASEPTAVGDLQVIVAGSKPVAAIGVSETDIGRGDNAHSSTMAHVTFEISQPSEVRMKIPKTGTSDSSLVAESGAVSPESGRLGLEARHQQLAANHIPEPISSRPDSNLKSALVLCRSDTIHCAEYETKPDIQMKPGLDKPPVIENQTCGDDGMEWVSMERQLKTLSVDLAGQQLTLPTITPPFIRVELTEPPALGVPEFPFHEVTYGMKSSVSMATITRARPLTVEGAVKRTLEVDISLEDCPGLSYEPGDALGFVCPNPTDEVEYLLQRLNLERQGGYLMRLSIISGTAKKRATLPKHIPIPCSVSQFLTHCAKIRCIPKKALLHFLSSCCHDEGEQRRLQELSSRQGAAEYTRLFSELHTDFLDVLHTFTSCQPPLERLVEFLPRLQPRYFSAASSPLANPSHMRIAFSVVELPRRGWSKAQRLGVATGWFERVTSNLMHLKKVQVPVFPRALNPFRLPADPFQPIIMIGPGTGVAPFIAFLEHRQRRDRSDHRSGKSWLFFGCRHPDKDHIYQKELETFLSDGTLTHLTVAYSRLEPTAHLQGGSGGVRYVQDCLRLHRHDLAVWMMECQAAVYVCGDAVNMSKDVHQAVVEVLDQYYSEKGLRSSGEASLEQIKEEGRYLLDVWS